MGILTRFFGREGESEVVSEFDATRVKPDVEALIVALDQLSAAMDLEESRQSNPGWAGRLRDLRNASGELRLLNRRAQFTKDELYEVLTTVRPLFRGAPPKGFAHLADLNESVIEGIETIHREASRP